MFQQTLLLFQTTDIEREPTVESQGLLEIIMASGTLGIIIVLIFIFSHRYRSGNTVKKYCIHNQYQHIDYTLYQQINHY